jgi:predicted Zn-dependent protease
MGYSRLVYKISIVVLLLTSVSLQEVVAHAEIHEMIEALDRQIEKNPDTIKLYLMRSRLHADHHDFKKALADLAVAEKFDPKAASYPLLRATVLFESGKPDAAHSMLKGWLETHPDDSDGWILKARILDSQGSGDASADAWCKGLTYCSKPTPELIFQHADAHQKCNDLSAALCAIDSGLSKLGPILALQQRAIELELEQGLFDQALKRVDTMLQNRTNPGVLYFTRARILEAAGRSDEAEKDWKAGLAWLEQLPPGARNLPMNLALKEEATLALKPAGGH